MLLIFATQLTAIATAVLAVFAILTTIYAVRAFRKQSQEVSDQAKMLKVQSERLEVYRTQIEDQTWMNDKRGEVLELQALEVRASLEQRKHAADEERRKQATRVTTWFDTGKPRWASSKEHVSGMPRTSRSSTFACSFISCTKPMALAVRQSARGQWH